MTRALCVLAAALAVLLLPDASLACAVCAGGGEQSRNAFLATMVGMSVLPLAMIGGVVWWIWRRTREAADPALRERSRSRG